MSTSDIPITSVAPTTQLPEFPTTFLAKESLDRYPCLDSIWNFFSTKGIKTVFLTLGASESALADLELAETLGCPLIAVPTSKQEKDKWAEVHEILKARARTEVTSKFSFSKGTEEKWILPKNIKIRESVPYWSKGTIVTESGEILQTENAYDWADVLCKEINVKNAEVRVDVLKMALPYELETPILYSLLSAGFRPGLIIIRWSKRPDTDVSTTLLAGHLQTMGYQLISKYEDKFLYIFNDRDWYMTCSWEDMLTPNPLIAEVFRIARFSRQTTGNGHAKFEEASHFSQSVNISSSGEATTDAKPQESNTQ